MTATYRSKEKWAVLVYLAGDNNLSEEMVWALQEIENAPRHDLVVLAQYDPTARGVPTARYDFRKSPAGGGRFHLEEYVVDVIHKETNSGAPESILGFIEWGIDQAEADHYCIVLSGHGSGADEDFLLQDDNPRDSLSLDELRHVLEEVKRYRDRQNIEILALDACLMSMCEVCYQVLDSVDIVIGSEGLSPNTGWPFSKMLECFVAGKPPQEIAKDLVRRYIYYYEDYAKADRSVDISAIDVKEIRQGLTPAMKEFSSCLQRWIVSDPAAVKHILLAHWYAQTYKNDQYVDLWDFCDRLLLLEAGDQVGPAARGVIAALNNAILESGYSGPLFQYSNGLSVYFPWSSVSGAYVNLPFPRVTGWHAFLLFFVMLTRRLPRKFGEEKLPGSLDQWLQPEKDLDLQTLKTSPEDSKYTYKVDRYTYKVDRYTHRVDRYTHTVDRYQDVMASLKSGQSGPMKNPALAWYPCTFKSDRKETAPLLEKEVPGALDQDRMTKLRRVLDLLEKWQKSIRRGDNEK
jgi:hypothetical protein